MFSRLFLRQKFIFHEYLFIFAIEIQPHFMRSKKGRAQKASYKH